MPAPYPAEFKRRAIELATQSDAKVAEVARDLGIAESGLRRWLERDDVDPGRKPGLTTDERKEPAELRRKTGGWRWRTRSSSGQRPTSPRRTSSQNDVPGRRPAGRGWFPGQLDLPAGGGVDVRVL